MHDPTTLENSLLKNKLTFLKQYRKIQDKIEIIIKNTGKHRNLLFLPTGRPFKIYMQGGHLFWSLKNLRKKTWNLIILGKVLEYP